MILLAQYIFIMTVMLKVKNEAMYNVGQLPKFSDDSYLTTDELRLIPTSEVFLKNLVADKIVEEKELPIRLTAYSECFHLDCEIIIQHVLGVERSFIIMNRCA